MRMFIRWGLVLLGFFHLANGLFMLFAPESWYAAVPGVSATGPMNHHFIQDIGFAFIASGTGLALGARQHAAAFAVAGAVWPALHALLHVIGWLQMGFPADMNAALSEAVGVVLVGALGVFLAGMRIREKGATS